MKSVGQISTYSRKGHGHVVKHFQTVDGIQRYVRTNRIWELHVRESKIQEVRRKETRRGCDRRARGSESTRESSGLYCLIGRAWSSDIITEPVRRASEGGKKEVGERERIEGRQRLVPLILKAAGCLLRTLPAVGAPPSGCHHHAPSSSAPASCLRRGRSASER